MIKREQPDCFCIGEDRGCFLLPAFLYENKNKKICKNGCVNNLTDV